MKLDTAYGLFGLLAMLCLGLVILQAPAPWFHDFAEWLYQARIIGLKLTAPELVTGHVVAHYPVPNSLAPLLLAGFTLFAPPLLAGKLYLLAQLAVWVWLLHRFTRKVAPADLRGAVLLVLLGTVALSSFFWYGFISYQLGLWLLLLFLIECRRDSSPWKLGLFGILLFFSHAVVVLIWCLVLAAWSIQTMIEHDGSIMKRLRAGLLAGLPLLPVVALAFWYLVGRFSVPDSDILPDAQMSSLLEASLFKGGYPLMLGTFRNVLQADGRAVFEGWPIVYLFGALSNAMLVILIGFWGLHGLWGARNRNATSPRHDPALWWVVYAVLVLYVVLPYNFLGLVNPAGRLLLPLVMILLLIAPVSALRWWLWAAAPAAAGLLFSILGYAGLVGSLPSDAARQSVSFLNATLPPPGASVFPFNQALYSNTRFPYFNYRVMVHSKRFGQLLDGNYADLGFRTGLLIGYRP